MPQFDLHFLSPLIFWSIVSFGILLFLLYRYAFPVIFRTLDDREKKIRESLEETEQARQKAQGLLAQYQAQLKEAHREVQAILEAARKQAAQQLEENERRVEQETQRMLAEARSEIGRERQQALREVQQAAVDMTLLAASMFLARSLTEDDHRRLIEEAVQEISRRYHP